mgnify:CR=1 FL=1
MTFYQELQLSSAGSKQLIHKTTNPQEKRRHILVYNFKVYLVMAFCVAVVSLFIIANTIKVTVFNRRKEINIMKYVGATDAFIRLPFFVEGFLLGLLSGERTVPTTLALSASLLEGQSVAAPRA